MPYTIQRISELVKGVGVLPYPNDTIAHLSTDSRKVVLAQTTLFFAIPAPRRSGFTFIHDLQKLGVRNFVVQEEEDTSAFTDVNFLKVPDVIDTLQLIAAHHRMQFNIPVVGITGSNGKTVVKEWLYQLLQSSVNIVRSPRSYNSQIGVPLSVWQMNHQHQLAIFEAGISQPAEMEKLQRVIKPTIGVLTNIGEAHQEGFTDHTQKAFEKLRLFDDVEQLVYCRDTVPSAIDEHLQTEAVSNHQKHVFSWSRVRPADLKIVAEKEDNDSTIVEAFLSRVSKTQSIIIPFTDRISIDNAITCWCTLLLLGYEHDYIASQISKLEAVDMRMQLKPGTNGCLLINDSYSNDLYSLGLALDYLQQQSSGKKSTVILSDILQSGLPTRELFKQIIQKISSAGVNRLVLIGLELFSLQNFKVDHAPRTGLHILFYESTNAFFQHIHTSEFRNEVILLKGARVFEFERITHLLEAKTHQTVLEVNLSAMVHNLREYRNRLKPETKLMAMVKAFSYGSGSAEVGKVLQYQGIDYLAVAYADEGIDLRKEGVTTPVMVMNPEEVTFDALTEHNLEPELYSFKVLYAFDRYINKQGLSGVPVHLKIDTGMHRLGFEMHDIPELKTFLQKNTRLIIRSVFSHLVASDSVAHDEFTDHQAGLFHNACEKLEQAIGYPFLKHLSNTAAIFRHPLKQLDMVRLGIGLYGVSGVAGNLNLQTVVTLKSTIAQLRAVKAGESVGYNRSGSVSRDSIIATVRIGYADGYSRVLGNGSGSMFIKGALAPVIGNVCMDMTMLDVTGINGLEEGDEVEVFGPNLPVTTLAEWSGTIPYEIMTGVSQRVKRVYYEE